MRLQIEMAAEHVAAAKCHGAARFGMSPVRLSCAVAAEDTRAQCRQFQKLPGRPRLPRSARPGGCPRQQFHTGRTTAATKTEGRVHRSCTSSTVAYTRISAMTCSSGCFCVVQTRTAPSL